MSAPKNASNLANREGKRKQGLIYVPPGGFPKIFTAYRCSSWVPIFNIRPNVTLHDKSKKYFIFKRN